MRKILKRVIRKFTPQVKAGQHPKDYSLHSGERQVGTTLADIRPDHLARYEFALNELQSEKDALRTGLGLDIFCGNGYGSRILSTVAGVTIWGCDGSKDAVRHAESYFEAPNVFFSHKLFPFRLPKAIADFAACFESLEHVRDDDLFLRVLVDAVRPGGVIFLSVPNQAVLPFDPHRFGFHFRHYGEEELRSKVDQLSARIEGIWSQDAYETVGPQTSPLRPLAISPVSAGSRGQFLIAKIRRL